MWAAASCLASSLAAEFLRTSSCTWLGFGFGLGSEFGSGLRHGHGEGWRSGLGFGSGSGSGSGLGALGVGVVHLGRAEPRPAGVVELARVAAVPLEARAEQRASHGVAPAVRAALLGKGGR